jgi:DNA-binding transcriptional LysR family regulator
VESVYLKTLVEVVRAGSLSRAAETLFVTQPAVSRRIKFLEEQYGYPLLDRTGPRLRPTEAGKLVYQKAETLLDIEAELVAGLRDLGGRTRISFSGTPSFGIAHLPAVLKDFMLTCGESADLSFASNAPGQILDGLSERLFDAAVMEVCDCFDLSAFATYPLPGDEMAFVSAPSLGLPRPEATVDALLEVPLFARREGCCARIMLEKNLRAVGRELADFRKLVVVDDLQVVVRAIAGGEGISYLSTDVIADQLSGGTLVAHHVRGFERRRQRALILTRPIVAEGPLARFVEALFRHFDQPVAPPLHGAAGPCCAAPLADTPAPAHL